MKLKLDANGNAVLKDGQPVYVKEDGTEITVNGAELFTKVNELTSQVNNLTTKGSEYEQNLKQFEGLDPAQAREALKKLSEYEAKGGAPDEKFEALKEQLIKQMEDKYAPIVAERDKFQADLVEQILGGAFQGSKFLKEKVAVPVDMVRSTFGSRFKVEDGRVVALDEKGNKVLSRAKAGEFADFDEAIGDMINSYTYKDQILKGSQSQGGGFNGAAGGQGGGGASMTRESFDSLAPAAKAEFVQNGGSLTD